MSVLVPPFDAARDHWRGGGGVVILEYGDYECPYSARPFATSSSCKRKIRRCVSPSDTSR